MKVKKIIAAITVLTMLSMTGCADNTSETNQTETAIETVAETTTAPAVIIETVSETTEEIATISETVEDNIFAVNENGTKILGFEHTRASNPNDLIIHNTAEYLNYFDYSITSDELFSYVSFEPIGDSYGEVPDLNISFAGASNKEMNFGCFSPVIENAINNYLDIDNPENMTCKNITGINFEELFTYIDNGTPVLVWTSSSMENDLMLLGTINGEITTSQALTASVLVGYSNDSVYLTSYRENDKYTNFSKDKFENIFVSLGSQAIVIEKSNP